ncbi:MAG: hypothetical protein NT053_07100 [Cyanobacteria bacterium]|nr:hypothetical protein [Cyanobacteriota bacterium]
MAQHAAGASVSSPRGNGVTTGVAAADSAQQRVGAKAEDRPQGQSGNQEEQKQQGPAAPAEARPQAQAWAKEAGAQVEDGGAGVAGSGVPSLVDPPERSAA